MLLYGTNLETLANQKIRGRVARIGGSVNQLLTYENTQVQDIDVLDGGYGDIRHWGLVDDPKQFVKTILRQSWQEVACLFSGPKVRLDRKTIILDAHQALTQKDLQHRFDACTSSNVIEHSYNPIFLLLNFYAITRKDGWQFHAVPHYQHTFDQFRTPTSVEHLLEDFRNFTSSTDTTHTEDYYQSAVVKHGYKRSYHQQYPVTYPYIHFHVFDEHNIYELFSEVFEDVTVDVIKTPEFSDVLVLARNRLKKSFVSRFAQTITAYAQKQL